MVAEALGVVARDVRRQAQFDQHLLAHLQAGSRRSRASRRAPRSISSQAWRRSRARANTVASGYSRRIARTVRRLSSTLVDGDHEHLHLRRAGRAQQLGLGRIAVIDRVAEAAHEVDLVGAVLDADEAASSAPAAGARRSGRSGRSRRSAPAGCRREWCRTRAPACAHRVGGEQARDRRSPAAASVPSTRRPPRPAGRAWGRRSGRRFSAFVEHHERELAAEREHRAQVQRFAPVQPAGRRPTRYRMANFTIISTATMPVISSGSDSTRCRSMLMPTAMKNRPSSRPLNGSICASSSWRNSESASSTPARNAPRPADRPATCMIHAAPSTISSAAPVNTSGICVRATTRNTWRSSTRPPITSAAIAPIALATSSQPSPSAAPARPSNGIAASSGIAAEILEQQDREREPAVVGGQRLALGQQLQADRRRRQRQAQADHQRRLPASARPASPARRARGRTAPPARRRRRTPACASPAGAPATAPGRSRTAASPRRSRTRSAPARRRATTRRPYGPSATPAAR